VIRTLYEDREGVLWIGTFGGGLDRFDRNAETFTHYLHDPEDPHSLGGNSIRAIVEDSQGNLWIGTDGGGLNRLDRDGDSNAEPGRFIRYQHDPADSQSLSNNNVWAITEDEAGVIWVGTGDGLNSFDPQTGAFTRYKHDPTDAHSLSANEIEALCIDRAGVLWVGTVGGGLNKLDRNIGDGQPARFAHYELDPDDAHSLSHNWVTVIRQDRNGVLWVGTRAGGLNRLDSETEDGQSARFARFQHNPNDYQSLRHNEIRAIYEDDAGILWFGTYGGVSLIDPQKQQFAHYRHNPADPFSLSDNDVQAIYKDRAGVLWVGTDGGGLNRLDPDTGHFAHYQHDPADPQSLSGNNVVSIHEDRAGVLWIGTIGGGLNEFDPKTERFTHYRHDPTDPQSLSHDHVRAIFEDRLGTLWIGTFGGGLNKLDRDAEGGQPARFTRFQHDPGDPRSLGHDFVSSIYEDRSGVLWVGTRAGGLNKFDQETEQFTRYQHDPNDPGSLSNNAVATALEDQSGVLWVIGFGGLNRFDRTSEQFSLYGSHDGLPTDILLGILEEDALDGDGPVLWISSGNGLSRFDTHANTFENYGLRDGLQGNGFNFGAAHKGRDGELYFGGLNGFNAFYPSDIQDNAYVPPVAITDFQLANKPVPIGEDSVLQESILDTKELVLAHDDRVISFEFTALNYSSPEKNRYRYKLEGFDEEWTEVGSDRRFVTYTNLDPGEYVFRVLGSNNDGVWNEEGTSLAVTITPPWWQTWWFRGGVILLLVGLVAGGFVWQRASARRRERQLEAQVAERTHELGERVKQLDCLFAISSLAGQAGISLDEILQGTVALLPPAVQYPEVACARLELDGRNSKRTTTGKPPGR
jgi:ligand-binding sensor domain-containing protein